MILAIVLLVVAGIIYYSTHRVPPDPLFQKEVYVEESDFWDDMTAEDFEQKDKRLKPLPQIVEAQETVVLQNQPKLRNYQKLRQQEKEVAKRRKKRKIANKSRQQNRRK